ncbi:MAG: hypothetical protein PUP93_29020 [Rhizonema sp. NSF051]|nr:hypothetical protein [Rhizonema sp. NSF051]
MAKRGKPALPPGQKKVKINITISPTVDEALFHTGNKSLALEMAFNIVRQNPELMQHLLEQLALA